MKKIYCLSKFDAHVTIENIKFDVLKISQNPIVLSLENEFIINILPLCSGTEKLLPYCAKFFWQNEVLKTNCKYISVFNIEKDSYLIILKKNIITDSLIPNFKQSYGKKELVLFLNENSFIQLINESDNKQINFEASFNDYEKLTINHFDIFKFYNNETLKHIFIINTYDFSIPFNSNASSIEIEDDNIKILVDFYDYFGSGKIIKFDNEFNILNEQFVFIKTPKLQVKTNLIPYVFLESVKQKNYKLTKFLCSETLKSSMDEIHLSKYFDKITEVLNFNINNPIFFTICDNKLRKFKFEIVQDKIENIIEV